MIDWIKCQLKSEKTLFENNLIYNFNDGIKKIFVMLSENTKFR